MPELIPVPNKDAIAEKDANVTKKISCDYMDGDLLKIGAPKGAFVFLADLIRQLTTETFVVDFARISSFGHESESLSEIHNIEDIAAGVIGKDVLIARRSLDIEISDSGMCKL